MEAINTNSDHGTKLVETSLMNKEFTELAYDHQLIEYNSAAHILSVQSGSMFLASVTGPSRKIEIGVTLLSA